MKPHRVQRILLSCRSWTQKQGSKFYPMGGASSCLGGVTGTRSPALSSQGVTWKRQGPRRGSASSVAGWGELGLWRQLQEKHCWALVRPSWEPGREQGPPALPRGAGAVAARRLQLRRCCPGSVHAPGRPDLDGGAPASERPASAARTLQLRTRDVRGSSFTPAQSLPRPASAFSPGCGEGNETWSKSPCWDLLQQGTPQPAPPPLFP